MMELVFWTSHCIWETWKTPEYSDEVTFSKINEISLRACDCLYFIIFTGIPLTRGLRLCYRKHWCLCNYTHGVCRFVFIFLFVWGGEGLLRKNSRKFDLISCRFLCTFFPITNILLERKCMGVSKSQTYYPCTARWLFIWRHMTQMLGKKGNTITFHVHQILWPDIFLCFHKIWLNMMSYMLDGPVWSWNQDCSFYLLSLSRAMSAH